MILTLTSWGTAAWECELCEHTVQVAATHAELMSERQGAAALPANVSLGSVLPSRGKTQLQRGHICPESTPSLLSINRPFSGGDSGRSWTPSRSFPHSTRSYVSRYAQWNWHRCGDFFFFSYVRTQKYTKHFSPASRPHMLSAPPKSTSLESHRHKAEITSPSSNRGGRERWLSDTR